MEIVDLSVPIVASSAQTPDLLRTEIEFADHAAGARAIEELFGVGADLLRDGEGWAVETFTRFGTHNSTHVDAPYHYNSMIRGEPAKTIDQLPLSWFFAPGVALDFHERADGEAIGVDDLEAALAAAGHRLRNLDIVLIRTGRDACADEPDYMARGAGSYGRGHALALRAWRPRHGYRRLGLGPAALDAGPRRSREPTEGSVLGRPSGRSGLLSDRARRKSRSASGDGLYSRLLPPAPGWSQRCARPRGRDLRVGHWPEIPFASPHAHRASGVIPEHWPSRASSPKHLEIDARGPGDSLI